MFCLLYTFAFGCIFYTGAMVLLQTADLDIKVQDSQSRTTYCHLVCLTLPVPETPVCNNNDHNNTVQGLFTI